MNEKKSLPDDNFVYRTQALTPQTLSGNFEILCRYLLLLFVGKFLDWYRELRIQLRHPQIRIGFKKIDKHYDAVLLFWRRLEPTPDNEGIEISKWNVRPEVCKEHRNYN